MKRILSLLCLAALTTLSHARNNQTVGSDTIDPTLNETENQFLNKQAEALLGLANDVFSNEPIDYVNPFVDTHKSRWFFFASASRPFGMVSLSPDTWVKGSWNSGYLYDSLHVRCFSHVHAWQMSGIPVMPAVGRI